MTSDIHGSMRVVVCISTAHLRWAIMQPTRCSNSRFSNFMRSRFGKRLDCRELLRLSARAWCSASCPVRLSLLVLTALLVGSSAALLTGLLCQQQSPSAAAGPASDAPHGPFCQAVQGWLLQAARNNTEITQCSKAVTSTCSASCQALRTGLYVDMPCRCRRFQQRRDHDTAESGRIISLSEPHLGLAWGAWDPCVGPLNLVCSAAQPAAAPRACRGVLCAGMSSRCVSPAGTELHSSSWCASCMGSSHVTRHAISLAARPCQTISCGQ